MASIKEIEKETIPTNANKPALECTLQYPNKQQLANTLTKGFDSDSNIIPKNIPNANKVNMLNKNIKLKIDGINEDEATALLKYDITLNSIRKPCHKKKKTELAKLLYHRIKSSEIVQEKTEEHYQSEKKLYFMDNNPSYECETSRKDVMINKIQQISKKPYCFIKQVFDMIITFDLRMNDQDISNNDRPFGISNELIKVMWKILHDEDIDGHKIREISTVFACILTGYTISPTQKQVILDKSNNNHKQFKKNLLHLRTTNTHKGNAFVSFANKKIANVLNELYVAGYQSNAIPGNSKRTNKNNNNNTNNKNDKNNESKKSKKRKNRDFDDGLMTPNINQNISKKINKTKHISSASSSILSPRNYGKHSLTEDPNEYGMNFYDSTPDEISNYEGRLVWSSQHHSNIVGVVIDNKLIISIQLGFPASVLKVDYDFFPSVPRIILNIDYKIKLDKSTLESFMGTNEEHSNNNNNKTLTYFQLPCRETFPVILSIPEELRNCLTNPTCETDMSTGSIAMACCIRPDKLIPVQNSLNKLAKIQHQITDDEIKQKLEVKTFHEFLENQTLLNSIDDMISERDLYFYVKKSEWTKDLKIPANIKTEEQMKSFYLNKFDNMPQWKKIGIENAMKANENIKKQCNYKNEIILSYGIEIEQFEKLMKDKQEVDKRIEISKNGLVVESEKQVSFFICSGCGWDSRDATDLVIEWHGATEFWCNVCISKTFKLKDNKTLNDIEEEKVVHDAVCIVKFPHAGDKPDYVVGKIYEKYARIEQDKQINVVSILLVNSKTTTEFIMNDNGTSWSNSRNNVKIISKIKKYKK